LLLARQSGSIGQAEFERQQEALHRESIETSPATSGLLPRVLLPVVVAALASAVYAWTVAYWSRLVDAAPKPPAKTGAMP
jgi:hypothetical protein